MRQTLTSILVFFFLGGLIALGHAGLLPIPFNILVSLDISIPGPWRKLTTTEIDAPSTSVEKKPIQSATNSPLGLSTAIEEKPAGPGVNSVDQGNKPDQAPKLTVARISTDGSSVFGGTAAPFTEVTVLDGTTPVDIATANANGDWSLVTDHKFATTDPKIAVRVTDAQDKTKLASLAPPASAPPTVTTLTDQTPPAAQLLKKFEGVVAAAREEAKQRDASNGSSSFAAAPLQNAAQSSNPTVTLSPSAPSSVTTTPVPMTFVYNEATLTPEGTSAARLLLEYLTLKKFASVTLSGHADERGLPDYNMELSRQRLATIEHVLRDGGYQGKLDLLPKGATEPFMGVDRNRYPHEELMQLDRRVELRVAN
jgi:outer membrane protein OmpA-like peptidoglycan-associated protein